MKILNEKGLSHFAKSGSPADKEGYLLKKGELNKGFQKRWFILKGNLLFYYEHKGDREPLGVIILEGHTIELAEDTDTFTFMINFMGSGSRCYFLSANSQESMESWMKALSCAGYEYIKLMVSELQNKLEEATSSSEASIIHSADRDSKILDSMYHPDGRSLSCVETKTKNSVQKRVSLPMSSKHRVNPFNNVDFSGEYGPGDAFHLVSVSTVSTVEIVTWSLLGVNTFPEMHEYVKHQIEDFQNNIPDSEENL
ncbi:sesquipedalian-1 [Biomphalaria glabrata]|uniref:Sesquipedalian-1-like n=2 Tax=Biomphalaria TaxID=6525 RepID=A0A2C9JJ42_BIOGL|nr:sesquipedalian-1-like [Biomphalaria glabrata]XP_013069498.1 sesquipedalian-1-like [Biomphalaria glabrata]XP_055880677.1 sesquipedalian-1-like [Biomphalaria glabrata]XP_055880679.1 sesquipedalian-1-like [Biomphalaria glabrata]XP_055880680.1 sesquipedalian-1-like [Biomphalaria glabrata]KAK0056947.1 sesquipedalian-1 [Biomphalaria pfeifferi]KAI8747055.1 sesquipedalian-1-like [Biomphalaria glabrata]KAI8788724.1 sesquipedalian-1 [Biomphalaria glabrata]